MSDAVSSAMRMLSVEPLTEGVPCHCATDGIFFSLPDYEPSFPDTCFLGCRVLLSRAYACVRSQGSLKNYGNVDRGIGLLVIYVCECRIQRVRLAGWLVGRLVVCRYAGTLEPKEVVKPQK